MTPAELATLEQRLSAERLTSYHQAVGGDLGRAVALYEWNADASAAFWSTLGHLEILVRNAMHDELTAWSSRRYREPRWYLDPARILNAETARDVATARRRATAHGRAETPGRVVAELSLGFWRFLLAARYERTLWRTVLFRAFPGQGLRRRVHSGMADLHMLRNRIAHHEPVHNRPLAELHAGALTIAGWICPTSRAWIDGRSAVPAVLTQRP